MLYFNKSSIVKNGHWTEISNQGYDNHRMKIDSPKDFLKNKISWFNWSQRCQIQSIRVTHGGWRISDHCTRLCWLLVPLARCRSHWSIRGRIWWRENSRQLIQILMQMWTTGFLQLDVMHYQYQAKYNYNMPYVFKPHYTCKCSYTYNDIRSHNYISR